VTVVSVKLRLKINSCDFLSFLIVDVKLIGINSKIIGAVFHCTVYNIFFSKEHPLK